MIKIICYKEGARKPKAHTKPMGVINSLLIKLGYRTSISYTTLELMGINTMSEKQEGERVWLIVYDDTHPCKSYTNEDVNYYKDFGDYFAPRAKRRAICRALIMKANAIA